MKTPKKRKVGRPAGQRKDGVSMRLVLARDAFNAVERYKAEHGLPTRTAAIEHMARASQPTR